MRAGWGKLPGPEGDREAERGKIEEGEREEDKERVEMDRGKDRETEEGSYSKGTQLSHQSLLRSLSAMLTVMGGAQEPAFINPWRSTFEEPLMIGSCL